MGWEDNAAVKIKKGTIGMKLWRCKDEMIVLVLAIIFSAYNIYPTFEQQLTNLQSILNFSAGPNTQ